ncbi:MAG: AhpC/TSA family protein [Gammaproteobacteria bacterium]|nr:AhpC/TSA family protein [Gammaproteobacteria bacterium]
MTDKTIASLAVQLETQQRQSAEKMPAEIRAKMARADEALAASGLPARSLREGRTVPDFTLPNARGEDVSLAALLARGPVVLSFYRGGWCPYCNLELRALQNVLGEIETLGASLVAISPEQPDQSLSTAGKNALAFEVLSDAGNRVARDFGLVFELAEELRPVFAKFGIDLAARNGDDSFELPVPATYVIDRGGVVRYAFVDTDYRKRAEPLDILTSLQSL